MVRRVRGVSLLSLGPRGGGARAGGQARGESLPTQERSSERNNLPYYTSCKLPYRSRWTKIKFVQVV
jgi:hypothetical protein